MHTSLAPAWNQPSCFGSLASQTHSVPQQQLLSVLARGGRVWRLTTTLHEQLERNHLLHTPNPPTQLATCSESYCTLSECCYKIKVTMNRLPRALNIIGMRKSARAHVLRFIAKFVRITVQRCQWIIHGVLPGTQH